MREKLKEISGVRKRFTATFERFGKKAAFKGPPITTLLFVDIRDKYDKEFCDHIWFKMGLQFKLLDLQPGDKISFDARVKPYIKGYRGRRFDEYESKPLEDDYKLSHPNNIVKHIPDGKHKTLFDAGE